MNHLHKTGYKDLNNLLKQAIKPKNLIYLIGTPKFTDFVLDSAKNFALSQKLPIFIFSFKYSKQALTQRLLSLDSGIPLEKIKKRELTQKEWPKFTQSAGRLASVDILKNRLRLSNLFILGGNKNKWLEL